MKPEEKLETFCICCGDPIPRKEMGLTVTDDRAPQWEDKTPLKITLHFCASCWETRKLWLTQGIRGAVERKNARLKNL